MLSKLIRYEFYATRRVYLPAFLALAILSILNAILMGTVWNSDTFSMPAGIVLTLYVFALFAVWVLALIYMIQRFYKNLLCDEGYLMFTLPAKPSQLIWAKAITSVIWMVLTAIVCIVSLMLIMIPVTAVNIQDVSWGLFVRDFQTLASLVWKDYGVALILVPLESIVFAILCVLTFCLNIYMCLSIGNLFRRHRIAWAFGAYVVCGIVGQIISLLFLTWLGSDSTVYAKLTSALSDGMQMYLVLLAMILAQVVLSAIYFAITNYILSKRLNLQ